MEIVVEQSLLAEALSLVEKAVPGRPSQPVLSTILFDADNGEVELSAFDLSLGARTSFPCQVISPGSACLPASMLSGIVGKLPPGEIKIAVEDTMATLISNTGEYSMGVIAADEFPALPQAEGNPISIPASAFQDAVKRTIFACSSDETKQVLNGVNFKFTKELIVAASTDGHRLSVVSSENSVDEPFEVTIPVPALKELEKSLRGDAVDVYYSHEQMIFQWGRNTLTTRLLEGNFPNYAALIPTSFGVNLAVNRKELIAAIDRVSVVLKFNATSVASVIVLSIEKDKVTLRTDNKDAGRARESIACEMVRGEPLDVAFNVKYLMEGLKALPSDTVEMSLNTPTSPAILNPMGEAQMTYLLMPIQIRS